MSKEEAGIKFYHSGSFMVYSSYTRFHSILLTITILLVLVWVPFRVPLLN
jgi:hypothetical protein